ncbi:MAG TPA: cell filamentation protein Fic [Sphaerochaeta sp.]|nr:cell filamentation protein Fic [Sphaerochaeta sp.]HPK64405.1 cell filamentation protein Fic [Sphaerochaeta sp.]HRV23736.1 cell filamentation protein Fic [Sphaerochaeta sp.]
MSKISIRLLDDREMRAVWDERNAGWWFSVLDIIGVLRNEDDPEKNRNYWKYLKAKLKREGNQGAVAKVEKATASFYVRQSEWSATNKS